MTHFHISVLGQCLISLAKQGVKSPLKRVLRFIQAGATVLTPPHQSPSSPQERVKSNLTQVKVTQCIAKPFFSEAPKASSIKSGVIKVSFSKAQDLLKYINSISSQQPLIDFTKQCSQQQQQYLNIQQQQKEQLQDQLQDLSPTNLMQLQLSDLSQQFSLPSFFSPESSDANQQHIEEQTSQLLQDLTQFKKKLEPQVEDTNLLQLRYVQSYPFSVSDIYNMSIGYSTLKTEKLIQEITDSFLKSHSIVDLMRYSQGVYYSNSLLDILTTVPLFDLVDNFNIQVLKREQFTMDLQEEIRELAFSILEKSKKFSPDSIH